jgi:hypothetical protein
MRTTVKVLTAVLILTFIASVQAEAAQEVSVEVTSISASVRPQEQREDGAVELDPRLAPISKSLKSLFAYGSYTFLSKERSAIEYEGSRVFRLPEHFAIEITPERPKRESGDMIGMKVTLFREEPKRRGRQQEPEREIVLRTEIRLRSGGTVLLGGPPIRNGVLVLALSAKG